MIFDMFWTCLGSVYQTLGGQNCTFLGSIGAGNPFFGKILFRRIGWWKSYPDPSLFDPSYDLKTVELVFREPFHWFIKLWVAKTVPFWEALKPGTLFLERSRCVESDGGSLIPIGAYLTLVMTGKLLNLHERNFCEELFEF